MNTAADTCTSYVTCGIALYLPSLTDIDWAALAAFVLLAARLVKDVPEAYDSVMARYQKWKNRDKGN